MTNAHISGLYIYPVKSLAGIALEQARLTHAGLAIEGVRDRQWAIRKANGHVLTQRQAPLMALIQPLIERSPKQVDFKVDTKASLESLESQPVQHSNDISIALTHPVLGSIKLPTKDSSPELDKPVPLWKDFCPARAMANQSELQQWLQEALESREALELVEISPQKPREFIDPSRFKVTANYFSDAAPYLVCNMDSLVTLNEHLEKIPTSTVDMRRFRPNIVASGPPAFSEHDCRTLLTSSSELALVDHCKRCIMTTVDPDSGQFSKDREPFLSISALNSMPGKPKAPAFGVNARLLSEQEQSIALNETVTLQA